MSFNNHQRLLRTLRAIEYEIDMSNFDERLVLQKTVYFIQNFGINCNYLFKWYLRGPYSQQLTRDAYQLFNMISLDGDLENNLTQENRIEILGSEDNQNNIASFLTAINNLNERNSSYWYELISSLHFLMRNQDKNYSNFEQSMDFLREDKPQVFSGTPESHVKTAWSILNSCFYFISQS